MAAPIRHLSAAEVAAVMPDWPELVDLAEEALKTRGRGETAPGGDVFMHAMPAKVGDIAGMTWVAGSPDHQAPEDRAGTLPYIHGTLILNDPVTGETRSVMDAGEITAKRTAACTAVTAKHLADPGSEVIAILACGTQGRVNISALLSVFPDTERMLCYDTDLERQAEFADWVGTTFSIAAIIPPEPQECCEGAHVIVTSGPISKDPKPVIEPDWIQTGTLCVPLDFDGYFTPAAFERADLLVTDDLAQFRHYSSQGYFEGYPEPTTDLPTILAGEAPGRPQGEPIVISANLGLGILDVALGLELLQRAEAQGVGTMLEP